MRRAAYILVAFGVLCGSGCSQSRRNDDLRQRIDKDFGQLPGLKETRHPGLREEFALIVQEGGTPELLSSPELPDAENVAAGLTGLFPKSRLESILTRSGKLFGAEKFEIRPADRVRAIRFRQKYDEQRLAAREALRRPKCDFRIQYGAGFAAELPFVDVVRICTRLEAFQAAESLSADDLDAAIESLGYMFRLAACLAAEKHPTTRFEAAFARTEAQRVLQDIVRHPEIGRPGITRQQLGQLHGLVEGQLKAWPDDKDAWIGDRAMGMQSYELIRAGHLIDLLTEEEVKQFTEEQILPQLTEEVRRTINEDELYYLQAMRTIIDGCDGPYYQRRAVFEEIREDLQEKRNSSEFPFVAGRLLLPDIEKGHVIQAQDRANCEAWALALALAAGRPRPPYRVCPLTGEEYEVVQVAGRVTILDFGTSGYGRPPVVVPDLSGQESEPTAARPRVGPTSAATSRE